MMTVIVRFHGIIFVNAAEQHRKLLDRFIQTLTENSIAIQNMRG